MIETLLGFLGSSAFGSITGIFGNWITRREERKNKEIDNKHELDVLKYQKELGQQNHEHQLQIADKNIEQTTVEGELNAFTESQKNDSGWMDKAKAIVRPLLTTYLAMMTTIIAYQVHTLVGGLEGVDPTQLSGIYEDIIQNVLYLTNLAFSWWYASRSNYQQVGRKN